MDEATKGTGADAGSGSNPTPQSAANGAPAQTGAPLSVPSPAATPPVVPAPASIDAEASARILEETIVKKAPAPPLVSPAPALPPTPPPQPPAPPAITPGAGAPSAPATAPSAGTAAPSQLTTDISKILDDIKLPERRDASGPKAAEEPKKTFDTSLGASVDQVDRTSESKEVPAIVTPGTAKQASSDIASVHTLKDDLKHVVRDQKMSLVRAASLEQDRKEREDDTVRQVREQRSRRVFSIMFAVILLLFLGASALFGVYVIMNQRAGSAPAPLSSSILFAENSVALPLADQSPRAIKDLLSAARAGQNAPLGSITRIIPVLPDENAASSQGDVSGLRPATFSEFIRAIGANPPEELMRALGDDFFLGIHTIDQNAPVIIVPVTSYAHAFSGMLAWEITINADLSPFFTAMAPFTRDEQGLPVPRSFSDLVMRNYDARVQKDDGGTIRLYYSFPTQGILVIAESPYSFPELLSRLQAQRKL